MRGGTAEEEFQDVVDHHRDPAFPYVVPTPRPGLSKLRLLIVVISEYLVTEPIVAALSTWIAFAWACVFLGGTSYILVFSQYGWNVGQASSVQL